MKTNNILEKLLISLGLASEDSFEPYYPKTRDREDISVLKCRQSGVIILSDSGQADIAYYQNKPAFSYWSATSRKQAEAVTKKDDVRRAADFKPFIVGKKWLDFGTGNGGLLDLLSFSAAKTYATELQSDTRKALVKDGYEAYASLTELPVKDLDIITFFHVLEHLPNPVEILKEAREKLADQGKIIIEVPQANDFLLATLDCEKFKDFTFWSEHLMLHTKESLKKFMEAAGFKALDIYGYQRYPLANHLYWLRHGRPGDYKVWSFLNNPDLEKSYADMLRNIGQTDTLIAIAEK